MDKPFTLPLPLDPLPAEVVPLSAVVVVKYLCDECSDEHLAFQMSKGLKEWDAIGMCEFGVQESKLLMLTRLTERSNE